MSWDETGMADDNEDNRDEHDGRTVDLRCAGFSPPIRSIADWLSAT